MCRAVRVLFTYRSLLFSFRDSSMMSPLYGAIKDRMGILGLINSSNAFYFNVFTNKQNEVRKDFK